MKISLTVFLSLVTLVLASSYKKYAWSPNREYLYQFETQVLSGIPEIRSQYAGINLVSKVRIQSLPDYSLLVKFEEPRIRLINEPELSFHRDGMIDEPQLQYEELPGHLQEFLVVPFEVYFKGGVVEYIMVDEAEPIEVTNIKRSLVSQLQLDVSGRPKEQQLKPMSHISSLIPDLEGFPTVFNTIEESILGECRTTYTVNAIPKYQVEEIELDLKSKLVRKQLSIESGEMLCQGKPYYQVVKVKDLDQCNHRPVYQQWFGVESFCDVSNTTCGNLFKQTTSTRYVICGSQDSFHIRSSISLQDVISNPLGWETEEKTELRSIVSLQLLKFDPITIRMQKPMKSMIYKSLIFDLVRDNEHQYTPQGHRESKHQFVPKPTMKQASFSLLPMQMPLNEAISEIKRIISNVSELVRLSGESSTRKGDAAGQVYAVSQLMGKLNYEDLKQLQNQIESLGRRDPVPESMDIFYLFNDILAMVGTNPTILLLKENIESAKLSTLRSTELLVGAISNVKIPTEQLVKTLFELIKQSKPKSEYLYSNSLIALSNLIHKAYIHPTMRETQYPVKIYGPFGNEDSQVIIEEYIPYLEKELEQARSNHDLIVIVNALGKLAHKKSIKLLLMVIQGEYTKSALVRSVAVISLKRLAVLESVLVRPVILSLIENAAENDEVRIAAISVLPWSQPSVPELQRIASRTWLEPSIQVSSFIYSTLTGLTESKQEDLRFVKLAAEQVLPSLKPVNYGIQYAKSLQSSNPIEYLNVISASRLEFVPANGTMLPSKISLTNKLYTSAFAIKPLSFSLYTEGLETVLAKIISLNEQEINTPSFIQKQIQQITEELKLKGGQIPLPEAHLQLKMLGLEQLIYLDSRLYKEIMYQVKQQVSGLSQHGDYLPSLKYEKVMNLLRMVSAGPSESGFLLYQERSVPMTVSLEASLTTKGRLYQSNAGYNRFNLPSEAKLTIKPIFNVKFQTYNAIVTPLKSIIVGTGVDISLHASVPLESRVEMINQRQLEISIKVPEDQPKLYSFIELQVNPYTFKSDMENIKPFSQSSDAKVIASTNPMPKVVYDIGKYVGVNSQIEVQSDNVLLDISSLYSSYMQNGYTSLLTTSLMAPSVRAKLIKFVYNPEGSEIKEFVTRFTLGMEQSQVKEILEKQSGIHFETRNICHQEGQMGEDELKRCVLSKQENIVSKYHSEWTQQEDKELCKLVSEDSYSDLYNKCLRSLLVCNEIELGCKNSRRYSTEICEKKKKTCQSRIVNHHYSVDLLNRSGLNETYSVLIESGFGKLDQHKVVLTSFVIGNLWHKHHVSTHIDLKVKIPQSPLMKIQLVSEYTWPKISQRWSIVSLIDEDVEATISAVIGYGYQSDILRTISVNATAVKSWHQKKSLHASTELSQCQAQIRLGRRLAPICDEVRHQAASLDKLMLKFKLPEILPVRLLKAIEKYIPYIQYVSPLEINKISPYMVANDEVIIEFKIARVSNSSEVKVQLPAVEYILRDIPMPKRVLKDILPISVRNSLIERIIQKMTYARSPPSCRIEPGFVSTFDNKTYPYKISECQHVILHHKCAENKKNLIVLAKKSQQGKEVTVITNQFRLILNGESGSVTVVLSNQSKINQKLSLELLQPYVVRNGVDVIVFEIKKYIDNVYSIRIPEHGVKIEFDGRSLEIVQTTLMNHLNNNIRGLCGDLNGELSADVLTPKGCILSKPQLAAYSYMLPGGNCPQLPASERRQFNEEILKCVKKEFIVTPVVDIFQMYKPRPLTKQYIFKGVTSNKICISKVSIKICQSGYIPEEVSQVELPFICLSLKSFKSQQILKRAKAGEYVPELTLMPVTFVEEQFQPISCKPVNTNSLLFSEKMEIGQVVGQRKRINYRNFNRY